MGEFFEIDAVKMLCPFIRFVINQYQVQQDNQPSIQEHANCVASKCIAWRRRREDKGYCGVAGMPADV